MPVRLTTKELTKRTWPDFDALFSRGSGWDFCACMAFQRDREIAPRTMKTRAEFQPFYRAQKQDLLDRGRAHGILVYADPEPVGWCQFGSTDELTIDTWHRREDAPHEEALRPAEWRITCFVTDKRYRRQGVAQEALAAALKAIGKRGGGVVEAIPIAGFDSDPKAAKATEIVIPDVGVVNAVHGTFGNVSTPGTVSMFERAGFKPVGVHRGVRVVMRRRVRRS